MGKVPSGDSELKIKATHTGITFLTEGRYRKRYTGSKTCAVDIKGNFWVSANDLKKDIESWVKDKKKPRFESPRRVLVTNSEESSDKQISHENSETEPSSENTIKKKRKKSYSVHKVEVRHRLYSYINSQKGKKRLYFWTITFPEGTPDRVCHQIFNIWLTQLRKYNMLHDYLWIKERQDGKRAEPGKLPTNTLHFHIAIPHYLDMHKANAMMRGTLKTFSSRGEMPGAVCDVRTKKVHYLPCIANYNGVDIAKHRKTRKPINFAIKKGGYALANYLTKYVTKNDTQFEQLAWHNSRGFTAIFTGVTFTVAEFKKFEFHHFLDRTKIFEMRYAKFIPWLYGPPPRFETHMYEVNTYTQIKLDAYNESKPYRPRTSKVNDGRKGRKTMVN